MKKPSKSLLWYLGLGILWTVVKKSENTRIHGAKASEFQGLERMNKKESRKPKEAETYRKKRHKNKTACCQAVTGCTVFGCMETKGVFSFFMRHPPFYTGMVMSFVKGHGLWVSKPRVKSVHRRRRVQ